MNLNGEDVLAGQSADIITHPDHQRKGLFGMLGKITEELAKAEGMRILFAFPNENSFPGFVRSLNWHHTGNFQVYRVKSNAIPIYRTLHKLRLGRLYKMFYNFILNKYAIKAQELKGSIPRSLINSGSRSLGFYHYKKYNSSHFIRYKGLVFWCKIDGVLWIGDISLDSNFSAVLVVTIIKEFACLLGLDEFIFEVSKGSYWDQKLKEVTKSIEGVPIVYRNLEDDIETVSLEFTGGDIDVF